MEYKSNTVDLNTIKPSKIQLFLYRNPVGRLFLRLLTTRAVSRIAGAFLSSCFSKFMIKGFVKNNNIDMAQFQTEKYRSYNDFFIRKIRLENRPITTDESCFISPADSKLSVYTIDDKLKFKIKNAYYNVESLINDDYKASKFNGGYAIVFRLCVDDYHRYCYVDNGIITSNKFIKGKLHTVQPIALEKDDFFKENCREVSFIDTENFGEIAQIEVGAMMVGKIVNHQRQGSVTKGEEKGYFKFGGSTIVLLVQKDKLKLDDQFIINTNNSLETIVKYRETIGYKY